MGGLVWYLEKKIYFFQDIKVVWRGSRQYPVLSTYSLLAVVVMKSIVVLKSIGFIPNKANKVCLDVVMHYKSSYITGDIWYYYILVDKWWTNVCSRLASSSFCFCCSKMYHYVFVGMCVWCFKRLYMTYTHTIYSESGVSGREREREMKLGRLIERERETERNRGKETFK